MSKPEHSPPPWVSDITHTFDALYICVSFPTLRGRQDATAVRRELEANRRLIDAAPDLLAACQVAAEDLAVATKDHKSACCCASCCTFDMLTEAIAKAHIGEKPRRKR